tara:strand:- start:26545 stop:27012 length:468 start_codon:yes stop_codon:yes gene_type:complete
VGLLKTLFAMDVMGIFTSKGDGSEDDGTFYSLSSEFLEAAIVLSKMPSINVNFTIAIYYLLSHSVELMLKAFLHKKGRTIRELRALGHNLENLVLLSRKEGLPSFVNTNCTVAISKIYSGKKLEYRARASHQFPNIDDFVKECKKIQSTVFGSLY